MSLWSLRGGRGENMFKPTGKDANIVIYCSDPRVVSWFHDDNFRKKLSIGKSHAVIAATGSIKFYLQENLMDKLYKQLDILIGHFKPQKIILLNHTDCGYYKSLGEDNIKTYQKDLREAKKMISEKFPSIQIDKYLLDTKTGKLL